MNNPAEVIEKIENSIKALELSNSELQTIGLEKSKADSNYKIAYKKELMKEKLNNTPIGIIKEIVSGKEDIAELKLKKDIAEVSYNTCLSSIANIRIQIETYRSILAWLRAEYESI